MNGSVDRARRGDLVRIRWIVLRPEERPLAVPADTRATPFVAWVNGYLDTPDAVIGDRVAVRTAIGRLLEGELVELNPRTEHDFGSPQPELLAAVRQLRNLAT